MRLALVWLGLTGCASRGCAGCDGDSLAVLVDRRGEVQRDYAKTAGRFEPAVERARFESGDALRTLDDATARLELPASGSVLVQSATTIRLWRGQRSGLKLNVQTGAAKVVAQEAALEIQTELGVAVLQAGSELRVRPAARGQRYDVTMGRAVLTTSDGQRLDLTQGESIGGAEPAADAGTPQPAPDAGAPQLTAAEGPSAAGDLQLAPGATAVIFDPAPPSRVELAIPESCRSGAQLSLRGQKPQRLQPQHALTLPAGTHDYHIACLSEAGVPGPNQWHGSLRVVKNPGTAQLPRSAPRNTLEADGRSYTVLFQNLLPVLEVRWPGAPQAPAYKLLVRLENGRELRRDLRAPVHVFPAGELPEGRHQLHFELASGAGRSRPTTIDLRFDNASPAASLKLPPAVGFEPGSSVKIAGIALPGAQVSVLGQRLPLDGQGRFAGEAPVPTGTQAIAVRIQHPRTGVRYYVRRVRSTP